MVLNRIKSLALVMILLGSVAVGATVRKPEHECSMDMMECCKLFKEKHSMGHEPAEMPCCVVRGPLPASKGSTINLRISAPVAAQLLQAAVVPAETARKIAPGSQATRVQPTDSQPSYIRNLSLLI
jgi:hypothetical protein